MDFTITVPEVTYAQKGSCIHVPCTFTVPEWYKASSEPLRIYWFKITNSKYYLYWINLWIMGSLMVTNDKRQNAKPTHFRLAGDPEKGDCSFGIVNVGKEDVGSYYLRVDKGEAYRHSYYKILPKVHLKDPKKPKIDLVSEVVWAMPVTIQCTVRNICSENPPEITWPVEAKPYAKSTKRSSISEWSWSYAANITFTPTLEDEGNVLTCHVKYPALKKDVQNSFHVKFGYGPKPIKTNAHSKCWYDKKSFLCLCSFEAWPPPALSWVVNGEELNENNKTKNLVVTSWIEANAVTSFLNITSPEYINDEYMTCKASNHFGKSSMLVSPLNFTAIEERERVSDSWPVVGIVAGSLVAFGFFGGLIFLIIKRQQIYIDPRDFLQ